MRGLVLLWCRQAGLPAGVSFKAKNPFSTRILGGDDKLQFITRLPTPSTRRPLAKLIILLRCPAFCPFPLLIAHAFPLLNVTRQLFKFCLRWGRL
jgi:hypothetical protein